MKEDYRKGDHEKKILRAEIIGGGIRSNKEVKEKTNAQDLFPKYKS